MNQSIGLFPLNSVALPGERLNLHIYEPRYRQLINDCLQDGSTFGIPCFIHKRIDFGTEIRITKLVKRYDDGRMDISTEGQRVFQVQDFQNPFEEKQYSGGKVRFFDFDANPDLALQHTIKELVGELFEIMKVSSQKLIEQTEDLSHLVHRIGLSLEKKYQYLQIFSAREQQEFLIEHLQRSIPIARNIEESKKRIKMNGHFKQFDPLDF